MTMTAKIGGRLFLRSIRIDNYKCFSDFTLPFGDMTLLLGKNGCGKTTVFDAINALVRFVCYDKQIGDLFPASTMTRWGGSDYFQDFELRASGDNGEEFCYCLTTEQHTSSKKVWVGKEKLTLNNKPLFEFMDGKGTLYLYPNSDFGEYVGDSLDGDIGKMEFPLDMSTSGLGRVGEHSDAKLLQVFRDWLRGITLLSLVPEKMHSNSDDEEQYPNADGSNFASWYRWRMQEDYTFMAIADEQLQRILPGYRRLKLAKIGGENHRELQAVFADNGKESEYAFSELSAGQRVLIALYCFLHGGGRNRVLLLDEPDNFVTLPEVQPLLLDIEDEAGDELPQVAIISHHPDAMDSIAPRDMVWMAREPEQPARIVEFENDTKLHTSRLYAQGMAP